MLAYLMCADTMLCYKVRTVCRTMKEQSKWLLTADSGLTTIVLYLPLVLAVPSHVCALRSSIGNISFVDTSFTTKDSVFLVVSCWLYNPVNISLTVRVLST